jgi:hypothetical protein
MPRLAAIAVCAFALASPVAFAAAPAWAPEPILASAEQDAAEELLLALLEHPDVKAIKAGLRAQLASTEIGRTRDGAATIDHAVECLSNSLILKEVATYRTTPAILWTTEDSPREWRGRKIGCVGTAGDNPDNIYRMAVVQGAERWEFSGRFPAKNRASQFIVQLGPGEPGFAPKLAGSKPEAVEVLGVFTDRNLAVAPDGSWRFTVGGPAGAPGNAAQHVVKPPGPIGVGFRDSMADWRQEGARLALRRLDDGPTRAYDPEELRRRVVGRMGDYVRDWADFPNHWFGGLKPNTYAGPMGREGAWGFVAGLRFSLAEDEALAVTISPGNASYTGFQVVDPWTMASDAQTNLTSLNLSQTTADQDGNFTYVIAPSDPGVANWLDTTGLRDGFGVIRWQGTPTGATKDGLLRSFRVIKLADAIKLPGVALTTPARRQAQIARRAQEWVGRLR